MHFKKVSREKRILVNDSMIINESLNGKKINYVSLGHFCSVANELEMLGLRTEALPFDWVISDFEGIILLIKDRFNDFDYYGAAEPPVRCGVSHLSGLTEPLN